MVGEVVGLGFFANEGGVGDEKREDENPGDGKDIGVGIGILMVGVPSSDCCCGSC